MSSSQARHEWRERRTDIVMKWARANGYQVEQLNSGYQLRVGGVLDIYPTNGRWHILASGERGDWHLKENQLNELYVAALRSVHPGDLVIFAKKEHLHAEAKMNLHMMPAVDFDLNYPQDNVEIPEPDIYRLHKIRADQGDNDSARLVKMIEEQAENKRLALMNPWQRFVDKLRRYRRNG